MADTGEDHKHEEHPERPDDERPTTTVVLDDVQSVEGSAEIDAVQDHLSDERVVDTGSLEDHRTVVEEVVGASQLLEHLEGDAKKDTICHLGSSEHVDPFLDDSLMYGFGAKFGFDLFQLDVDAIMVLLSAVYFEHNPLGFVLLAFAVEVSRCLRED